MFEALLFILCLIHSFFLPLSPSTICLQEPDFTRTLKLFWTVWRLECQKIKTFFKYFSRLVYFLKDFMNKSPSVLISTSNPTTSFHTKFRPDILHSNHWNIFSVEILCFIKIHYLSVNFNKTYLSLLSIFLSLALVLSHIFHSKDILLSCLATNDSRTFISHVPN